MVLFCGCVGAHSPGIPPPSLPSRSWGSMPNFASRPESRSGSTWSGSSWRACSASSFLPCCWSRSRIFSFGISMGNLTCDGVIDGGRWVIGPGVSGSACALFGIRLRALVELQLAVGAGHARIELAGALALGVQLGAEQDRDVGEPDPDEEDHDAAKGAVGLVIGAEVGDVEREAGGGDQPHHDRE